MKVNKLKMQSRLVIPAKAGIYLAFIFGFSAFIACTDYVHQIDDRYGEWDSSFSSVTPQSNNSETSVSTGSMTDSRDGQTYKTVKIGEQVWMSENLNFEIDSSFCYNNEESYCTKYGRLYRWAAAVGRSEGECGDGQTCSRKLPSGNIQGVCPSGWHLPSMAEWETLFTAVGGQSTAGNVLKSISGWYNSGNGTDSFGFSALPAGSRLNSGNYGFEGASADFWCSTENGSHLAYYIDLGYTYGKANLDYDHKYYGYSVRCLQD